MSTDPFSSIASPGKPTVADGSDAAYVRRLMEASTQAGALAILDDAAQSGYDSSTLVDLLDYARVVPNPVLDRVRSEFMAGRADPYHPPR